ncbi:hypothetical protein CU14913_001394 [Campylobacter upsaliensis]|nr:hypothetical protein [Campylobacter upsaliensis]CAG9469244.1 hypothetical protein CU14913_001394 [Campylobacter upsaliensis]
MITNPNSAIQRIKNHLSYKLGQELIKYNTGGGGGNILTLFLKLRKIQKMHKAHQKFYKKTTVVFPQLHYPALENCEDYKESLKCKFHLSYLLGEVFIKALKKWYKGGLLKLNKDFKKAYEKF